MSLAVNHEGQQHFYTNLIFFTPVVPPSQFPDQIVESGKGSYSFNLSLTIQSQFNISNIETDCKELTVEIQEPDHNTAKVRGNRYIFMANKSKHLKYL